MIVVVVDEVIIIMLIDNNNKGNNNNNCIVIMARSLRERIVNDKRKMAIFRKAFATVIRAMMIFFKLTIYFSSTVLISFYNLLFLVQVDAK